jgi:hypothetical protein
MPDIQPPAGGLPPGPCTVTLTAHTASGDIVVDTGNVTVLVDADHDGIPASLDVNCSGGTADNDANSRFADYDGDGIPNGQDSSPCTSANTVTVDFDPNTLNITSSGVPVTMYISAPAGRDLRTVTPSTVKITQIAGYAVSIPKIYWSAGSASCATAQFDRQAVNQFFASHPELVGQKVKVYITGTAPSFTMRGADPNAPLVSN